MNRRTTLRPVGVVGMPEPIPPAPSATLSIRRRAIPWPVVLVLIGVVVAGLAQIGRSGAAAPAAPAAPAAVTPVPDATALCSSVASFLEVIASYESQARWTLAASTAQTALRAPDLCEADRNVLGQKLVALSREALFEQPPAPEDGPDQRRVASAYADLKTMATEYGAPLPPLPIAQRAYDDRLFLLAIAAYADAFRNGDSSPADRETVRADYAAQYNLGLAWSGLADPAQRQEGLARLATACRIDERDQLGSPEACNQLQVLAGPRTGWPAPAADPLLDLPPALSPPGRS
jgi:hypothetical protein